MTLHLKCPYCEHRIDAEWADKLAVCPGCARQIHRDEAYSHSVGTAAPLFLSGDVCEAFAVLSDVLGYEYQCSNADERLGRCLLDYNYSHLTNVDDSTRQEFKQVMALRWLFQQFGIRGYRLCNTEPLAVLLEHDYALNLETERMCRELQGDASPSYLNLLMLPVAYDRRLSLWPELSKLKPLSLAARTVYVHCLSYFQARSGLCDFNRAMELRSIEARLGLRELDIGGLLMSSPPPAALLAELKVDQLRTLAFEKGIETFRRKQWVIDRIVENLSESEIMDYLAPVLTGKHLVQPLVSNDPLLLKRFIRTEQERLSLYRRYVRDVVCVRTPPSFRHLPEFDRWRDKMTPLSRPPDNRASHYWTEPFNQTEISLIDKFWDARCDEIVVELAVKFAWNAQWFISEAIQAYLGPERLEEFKRACAKAPTHAWYNALMYYGEARIDALGVPIREARVLRCAYCGDEFSEGSIPIRRMKSLDGKILFCRSCYARAFWLGGQHRKQFLKSFTREEMLQRLSEISGLLGFIPLKQVLESFELGQLSEERQIKVVTASIEMPSYEDYVREFGSWAAALALAGVLDNDAMVTERGTRCVALDGHACGSIAEKSIDDWFHIHGIPHEREPTYPPDPVLNPNGRMRADWKVDGALIEYAGMMQEPEYRLKMDIKQQLSEKLSIPLIVLLPNDLANLDMRLRQFLR